MQVNDEFGYGALLSPIDKRDYTLSKVENAFPLEFKLKGLPHIKNQSIISSCVAFALSYINEIYYQRETGEFREFSVGYIYGNRNDMEYKGKGLFVRDALKTLMNDGNVFYSDLPYNQEVPKIIETVSINKPKLKDKAYLNRISGFARVNTEEEIKTSLLAGIPIIASYPVYKRAFSCDFNGNMGIPDETDKHTGNHAVLIVGWTKDDKYIIQNSWGVLFGQGGYAKIPMEYPSNEMWIVTDNITNKLIKPPKWFWLINWFYKLMGVFGI
jgi:C1A family cysteine protease